MISNLMGTCCSHSVAILIKIAYLISSAGARVRGLYSFSLPLMSVCNFSPCRLTITGDHILFVNSQETITKLAEPQPPHSIVEFCANSHIEMEMGRFAKERMQCEHLQCEKVQQAVVVRV